MELRAASLNHLEVWVRKGLPSVPKPRILGADGAGVVAALGDGVEGLSPGDRVVINPGLEHGDSISIIGEQCDGTHCELFAVAAAQVFPLDDLGALRAIRWTVRDGIVHTPAEWMAATR